MEAIIIAFISGGGLVALVKAVSDIIISHIKSKKSFETIITRISNLYSYLEALKAEIKCARVLVVKTSNGGGVPKVGLPLYASVLYETYDQEYEPLRSFWQNRLIDQEHIKILTGLESSIDSCTVIKTDELKKSSLKDIYTVYAVDTSIICKIAATELHYYYLTCDFVGDTVPGLDHRVAVVKTAHLLRELIT